MNKVTAPDVAGTSPSSTSAEYLSELPDATGSRSTTTASEGDVIAHLDVGQDRVGRILQKAVRTLRPLLDELTGGHVTHHPLGTVREVQRGRRHVLQRERRLVAGHAPSDLHEHLLDHDRVVGGRRFLRHRPASFLRDAAALLTAAPTQPWSPNQAPSGSPAPDDVDCRPARHHECYQSAESWPVEATVGPPRVVVVTLQQGLVDLAIVSSIAAITPILAR
jgi:hypothetical protein